MQDQEKPKKYNEADTRKPGSPIETPFKHTDPRSKKIKDPDNLDEILSILDDNNNSSIEKADD